jgi:hypothetical protein
MPVQQIAGHLKLNGEPNLALFALPRKYFQALALTQPSRAQPLVPSRRRVSDEAFVKHSLDELTALKHLVPSTGR